ncbi:MAG: hypothetical protein HOQ11_02695 [Gemmatimonadaceae bacterium]|nr:hypothetical protein [Gemmatimonadaceae bacterium]NUQ91468.1 hypothetical protein [Gemmatimonadaceae bacterium]NUR20306.1 hypothetical protein [Gemmatimonadaceae bacterium]NUS96297.1 hypothetical protein [Gemmatimonadaceae bacterium]
MNFSVFGGCLRSELEIPGLSHADGSPPTWTFARGEVRLPADARRIGRGPDLPCEIELFADGERYWLKHSCTGTYRISRSGREIIFEQQGVPPSDAICADLTGRVLAIAMHAMGWATLHASAVAFRDGAVALLAPKHHGKSTLAIALTQAGGRLVTDDMLPVVAGARPIVHPGIQRARLNSDSRERLIADDCERGIDGKHVVGGIPAERLLSIEAPLAALYFLKPVTALPDDAVVRRTRISTTACAIGLVRHAKIGYLLGGSEAPVVFDRASGIARSVPAFELEVVRELSRVDEAAELIAGWHGGAAAGEDSTSLSRATSD